MVKTGGRVRDVFFSTKSQLGGTPANRRCRGTRGRYRGERGGRAKKTQLFETKKQKERPFVGGSR